MTDTIDTVRQAAEELFDDLVHYEPEKSEALNRIEAHIRALLAAREKPLREEIARLKRGDFTAEEFQNQCHNLDENDVPAFFDGCDDYQRKRLGRCRTDELRAERDKLAERVKAPDLSTLRARHAGLEEAAKALLEIGKRDLSNPKYDGYFNSLRVALSHPGGGESGGQYEK